VRETVKHLSALRDQGKLSFAGIGLDRDQASAPAEIDVDGAKVAFSAIGNVTNMNNAHRAGDHKPGTMGYRHDEDWQLVTQRLSETPADLRLLSIHYGQERDIRVDDRQRREYRFALAERGVDVVIGHHAHVVRGIELDGGKLIFYGLGNFLIRGAADMGAKPELRTCCDYGLLAKVYLRRGEGGHFRVRAVEAFPVADMNRAPRRLEAVESGKRIEVLNVLAEGLDDPATGARGVRFQVMDDGRGLFCVDGAAKDPGAVGSLCQAYTGPTTPSKVVRARVRGAPHPKNTSGGVASGSGRKQPKHGKAGRGRPITHR
jgi:poly-gamma-glutamate synthesis protein (capsule biosynthesis protein)